MTGLKVYRVGRETLDAGELYEKMLTMFVAQNKAASGLYHLRKFKKHQMTLLNTKDDVMGEFIAGYANFLESSKAPTLFTNYESAFEYIFQCFVNQTRSEVRKALSGNRNSSDWTLADWRSFSSDSENTRSVSMAIAATLREIRKDKTYQKWERNTICKFILSRAQACKIIPKKKCRKMVRAMNTKEKSLRAEAMSIFRKSLQERIHAENIRHDLLAG